MKKFISGGTALLLAAVLLTSPLRADTEIVQKFDGDSSNTQYKYLGATSDVLGVLADTGSVDKYFRLLSRTGNLKNRLYFDGGYDADNYMVATFDVRMTGDADGINFSFVDAAAPIADTFSGSIGLEKIGLAKSLSVGFGVYNEHKVRLFWNETDSTDNNLGVIDNNLIKNGQFFTANVAVNFAEQAGTPGAYVTVTLMNKTDGTIYSIPEQFVAGLEPYTSNILFAGRTGGSTVNADLDNIRVLYGDTATTRWTPGRAGTLYADGAQWEAGLAPGVGGTAHFYASNGTNNMIQANSGDFAAVDNNLHLLVTGGTTDVEAGKIFVIGLNADETGSMTMEAGNFNITGKTMIAHGERTTGTLTINGGHFKIDSTELNVIGDHGTGSVVVNGGRYEINSGEATVLGYGDAGTGTLEINNGMASFTRLTAGREGDGTLQINGGRTTVSGVLTVGSESGGDGKINIAAGTMVVSGAATLGGGANSTASINVTGGSLTTGAFSTNTGEASSASLSLSGDAKMTVNGGFTPMHKVDGTGKFVFSITDDAELTVTGNLWGGNNDAGANPLVGEEYAIYYTFSGNSKTSAQEMWLGMSAKSYVLIEENATLTATANNTGVGWNNKGAGSKLEMTGGTINCLNFRVGENVAAEAVFSGGVVLASGAMSNRDGSKLTITGDTVINVAGTFSNNGTLDFSGGTLNANAVDTNLTVSGGTLNAGSTKSLTFTGGTLSPGGDGSTNFALDTEYGTTTIDGSLTLENAVIQLDISDSDWDQIVVSGQTAFGDNVLLHLDYSGAEPDPDATFQIMELLGGSTGSYSTTITGLDAGLWGLTMENGWLVLAPNADGGGGAVPEPATCVLLGLGLLAMAFFRKRKV